MDRNRIGDELQPIDIGVIYCMHWLTTGNVEKNVHSEYLQFS